MKKIVFGALISLALFASCKKDASPTKKVDEIVDTSAALKYGGMFDNGPYGVTSGTAKIYLQDGKYILSLENFMTSNGPDLHVYLSKERLPVNFIDLGRIKSTNGNQLYIIGSSFSAADYQYALIHCQQFNHLFGSAQLQ